MPLTLDLDLTPRDSRFTRDRAKPAITPLKRESCSKSPSSGTRFRCPDDDGDDDGDTDLDQDEATASTAPRAGAGAGAAPSAMPLAPLRLKSPAARQGPSVHIRRISLVHQTREVAVPAIACEASAVVAALDDLRVDELRDVLKTTAADEARYVLASGAGGTGTGTGARTGAPLFTPDALQLAGADEQAATLRHVAEYVKRQNAAEETLVSAFEEYAGLARGIDAELAEFDAAVKRGTGHAQRCVDLAKQLQAKVAEAQQAKPDADLAPFRQTLVSIRDEVIERLGNDVKRVKDWAAQVRAKAAHMGDREALGTLLSLIQEEEGQVTKLDTEGKKAVARVDALAAEAAAQIDKLLKPPEAPKAQPADGATSAPAPDTTTAVDQPAPAAQATAAPAVKTEPVAAPAGVGAGAGAKAGGEADADAMKEHEALVAVRERERAAAGVFLAADPGDAMKKVKGRIRIDVRKCVNKIAKRREQVLRAAQELKAIIESKQGNAAELAYTKLTIAEQIVEKATKECYVQGGGASALAMATPLAMVITLVAIYVPDMAQLFMAECQVLCPYTIPMFVDPTAAASAEEYKLKIGYKSGDEPEDHYRDRMRAIVRVYGAAMQTDISAGRTHPFGMARAWTFLARLLNMPPQGPMAAEVLQAFLEVSGWKMTGLYKGQFTKVMVYIRDLYLPLLPSSPQTSALKTYVTDRFVAPRFGGGVTVQFSQEGRDLEEDD